MAAGVGMSSSTGKVYPGNLTRKVLITCMVAGMGGLIFGYDIGISGGVTSMPSFLKEFFPSVYRKEVMNVDQTNQYCKFNSLLLTMFTSSLYLAALVASICASSMTRLMGRRSSMLCGGALFCFGAIINGFARNIAMLIIGRLLLGFGIGFTNQSVPLYLSEMAPYRYRGALNIGFQMCITLGILAANLLNYFFVKIEGGWGWRLSLGGATVPALVFVIGSFCLPDTPNSLIERKMPEKAKEMLQKIRGSEDVDEEFNDMVLASEESNKIEHPWFNLLKRKYRPQLTFAFFIPFFQQLTGMNIIMFYAPILFQTIGFGNNASLMSSLITGIVNSIATVVSIVVVDKVGRRALFLEGGVQMFVCQVAIAIAIGVKFGTSGNPSELSKGFAALVVLLICIFVSAFAWSWGPMGWLVPSEIFPLEIRSAAQSLTVSVNMLSTFLIAQIFLQMLCSFKYGLFIFFSFFLMIMSIFIYLMLPETKGIPIEEMSNIWNEHWFWKKFVSEPSLMLQKKTKPKIEI